MLHFQIFILAKEQWNNDVQLFDYYYWCLKSVLLSYILFFNLFFLYNDRNYILLYEFWHVTRPAPFVVDP